MINAEVTGIGIHSGQVATVRLSEAPAGTGIVFHTKNGPIAARIENVVETRRCTVLGSGAARVSTVEHLLSACAGLGIVDLRVEVDGPELPILEGSAATWAQLLSPQPLVLRPLLRPLLVTGSGGAFIACYPAETLSVTVAISFEHPLVGTQLARFVSGDDYGREIAPARTFGFIEEVQKLLDAGLAKGGSLDNAVIVYPDHYQPELRFENELARHKLLDLIGDLSLAGLLPNADIIAVKPSHTLNTQLAAKLAAPS